MAGEPEWMVEAALRRKREELGRRWQERERVLEGVRRREREAEGRGRAVKRVRVGEGRGKEVDEEREFLIADWEGGEDGDGDSGEGLGGLSSETRALMEKVGLGGGGGKRGEEEGEVEDVVKVCCYFISGVYVFVVLFLSFGYFFLQFIIFSSSTFSPFPISFVLLSRIIRFLFFFPLFHLSTLFTFVFYISSVSHLFIFIS
jgi:hypothetical protein